MVCLDTTFLIDLLRGDNKISIILNKLERSEESVSISAASIMELVCGASSCKNILPEKEKVMKLLESMIVLEFNKDSAILAGEIGAYLRKEGNMIEVEDIIIGATAVRNNEVLITRNKKHFERIKELQIEGY